ncbi:hypothetical protein [Streptomyces sp. NRRL F-5123]|uniref:hypothetical protein n=1 Tax=Streptomyces sp. NRRL F-5123 TaxID=1463856 RepID=UPI0004E23F45|nr:hypothetical protein [Streptomyces sp. NRRL F-5123]
MTNDDAPWTLNHQPRILIQNEARPGAPDTDGRTWTERRLTGLGVAFCDCGYTTGLVPREQLPDGLQFAREHPPFGSAALAAAEGGTR